MNELVDNLIQRTDELSIEHEHAFLNQEEREAFNRGIICGLLSLHTAGIIRVNPDLTIEAVR